jgi:hypothetical protein
MPEKVQKGRVGAITVKNVLMVMIFVVFCIKDMAKKLFTKLLEKKILGFKVGVKGCSADIGTLDDFTNRY